MKVLLVLLIMMIIMIVMIVAAATVVAYGTVSVTAEVEAFASSVWTEPAALLVSGSVLLGVASAVRRLPL